jgi:hypothetical protein
MDKNSQAFWENQFKNYEASSLNKEDFCSRYKLDRNLFYRWLKDIRPDVKGRHKNSRAVATTSSFISLKEASNEKIQVRLSSGIELTFTTDTSPRWIASFLKELEGLSA